MTIPNGNSPGGSPDNNGGATGYNPSWDQALQWIPDEHKDSAKQLFGQWDSGVNTRFQELHSKYEPYKEILDEYDPEDLQTVLAMANALAEDPREFWQQMAQAYNLSANDLGQGSPTPPGQNNNGGQGSQQFQQQFQPPAQQQQQSGLPPEVQQQMLEMQQAIANLANGFTQFTSQTQEEKNAQYLESVLSSAGQKYSQHGPYDRDYVLAKIANGMEPEDAIKQFYEMKGVQIAQDNNQQLPPILGTGGGLPSQQQDFSKMAPRDTQSMVANLVAAAQQASTE